MISLDKLKERKLVQWALAYLAGAWLVLQVASLLSDAYSWPPFVMRAFPVLLGVGFLATLVVAWYHGERGEQRVSTVELGMLTALLVIAGVGVAFLNGQAEAEAGTATPARGPVAPAPVAEQGSIAVLPFADMSAERDQEYFTDGLTEELLNALAQLPELRVASRTSAFAFKGTKVGIDSIARALNVRHVLEGSVRKAGDEVRITAQLIDAETGYHLWSETYDRELADIFAVQDEISRAIVSALELKLGGGSEGPLVAQETANPEAHTLVLKGEYARSQGTRESTVQAERFFEQALALDSEYARARAGLARVYAFQAYQRWIPPAEGYTKAKVEAERSLELDPGLAPAHVVLGQIAADHEWDWEAADAHLARALEASPGYAQAHGIRSLLLVRLGRTEEAIEAARRAVELDPVSPGTNNDLANVYIYSGHPERALEQYRATLALVPGHPIVRGNLAIVQSFLGRHTEAVETARAVAEAEPEFSFALLSLAFALARTGQRAEAEQALADLEALPEVSAAELATVHAALGNRDHMFALLEQAVEERDAFVTYVAADPAFGPYQNDPRMRRLLERIGLR